MPTDPQAIVQISRVQEAHSPHLLTLPNVIGTAIGQKITGDQPTGDLALIVLVRRKVPLEELRPEERIPATLEDVLVDVQAVGDVLAV